jgi:hypothetical protein
MLIDKVNFAQLTLKPNEQPKQQQQQEAHGRPGKQPSKR